ncbi:MAG: DNA repair protein RadA [Lachnospiraceae bacterium]|nr:DNA repair protein RadA [Lachnospiraceae bacterium]
MAKNKTVFVCQSCGYETNKWLGQCPMCKEWNTFVEEKIVTTTSSKKGLSSRDELSGKAAKPVPISKISASNETRISTSSKELDRVLGGGIVPGSLVLIGGDPGIGKSTLLLQVAGNISKAGKKVLYISGEESLEQIKLRGNRMGDFSDNLLLLSETDLDLIDSTIRAEMPDITIIDSIQTMYKGDISSAPGSVSQVRESTNTLMQIAKSLNIAIFIVGHVTKEGQVAGPRVLEHMVDTVLYFEGDRYASYRIIRGVKNRFGSTNEIGVFEMKNSGLEEVPNPSEFLLSGKIEDSSGTVISCAMEGTRPLLLEIQGLTGETAFGMPRRTAEGFDFNRLNLLIAVIEKRMGYGMGNLDAYINIAGGIRMREPALDLGIVIALVSSYKNKPIPSDTVAFGEVGLSGEVRAVTMPSLRVSEAKKLGFKKVIMPSVSMKDVKDIKEIEIVGVRSISDLKKEVF